jgi:putative flippase GtrA
LNSLYSYAHNLPAEPKRFLKFVFVGSLGFIVDFGTFNLIHLFYNVPDATSDEVTAQAISFTLAVIGNFLWNYFWIYRDSRTKPLTHKVGKFIIVSVAGLIIRTPVFNYALPLTHRLAASSGLARLPINAGNNLALACAVLVVLLWNFFVNRYWTYNDVA